MINGAPTRQQGATLVVGLILLVMMTLFAFTAFKLGKGNLLIAGNAQQRDQALTSAQAAIEEVISAAKFFTTPADAVRNKCNLTANTMCFDVNGDATNDVTVTVVPTCISILGIPASKLDLSVTNDAACVNGIQQEFGTEGVVSGGSLCANTLWDVRSTASDPLNNVQQVVSQGVAVRVLATYVCP